MLRIRNIISNDAVKHKKKGNKRGGRSTVNRTYMSVSDYKKFFFTDEYRRDY
jgi:hypothetical protein